MATDEHYFIEENKDGKFAVRAKGSQRASRLCDIQEEAEELVKKFNPNDKQMWSGYETPRVADAISGDQSEIRTDGPGMTSLRWLDAGRFAKMIETEK